MQHSVEPASPRRAAQVRFSDGRVFEAPFGTPLEDFTRTAFPDPRVPVMAALVDGKLKELTWPVSSDVEATPVTLADYDGERIYRRSLSFLLVAAAQQLFPQAQVYVDYPLPFGGYFCEVRGREPFIPQELDRLDRSRLGDRGGQVPVAPTDDHLSPLLVDDLDLGIGEHNGVGDLL